MSTIYLGNSQPGDVDDTVTIVDPPEGDGPADILAAIVNLWPTHSSEPPTWVASDDESLAKLIASQFKCKIRTIGAGQNAYIDATTSGE